MDIARMRFHERIELDTITYKINKQVLFVSFDIDSVHKGYKHLFDVK